jgi:hypothetical protein
MTRRLLALIVTFVCVCPLYVWQRRLNEQIGHRLTEEGNPSGLQSPDGLTVWSDQWRAYRSIENAQLRRQVTLAYRVNWAIVLILGIGMIAYFYLLAHD